MFKYLGYAALSCFVAWISTLGREDYIANLCNSIIQVLIALLALYSTVSSLLISRLLQFCQEINQSADLYSVIESMKRNVRIEAILILCTLLSIVFSNLFLANKWFCDSIVFIIRNAIVVFALLYFVIVVYDSTMGLYDLLQFRKKNDKE